MSRFHINKHGAPATCKAKQGNCPLGGEESHFDTQEEAQEAADSELEREFGLIPDSDMDEFTEETLETSDGLEYSVIKENNFEGYDKTVADTHLSNYGEVYLDSYGDPIDNEYELEEVNKDHKKRDPYRSLFCRLLSRLYH